MYIHPHPDGRYVLICDRYELSLVAEGLHAVAGIDRRCLERGIPDEFDTPVLEEELELLERMQVAIAQILDQGPVFSVIDGSR